MGSHSSVKVTVLGAAGTVTGSKYLVETDKCRFLVDCGLFQGKKEWRLRNWAPPPFDVSKIDAVFLTHAHIDHTGYAPLIVKHGYRGPIYATSPTVELTKLLLKDSAFLQEEEARYANKHNTSKHHPAEPLYTVEDAKRTNSLLRPLSSAELPGVRVSSATTGHILGSVSLSFELEGKRISFSGDIGRFDQPILCDPQGIDFGDLLFCESTYGSRLHDPEDIKAQLKRVIAEVVSLRGPLLIPAFAVGRTQHLLYILGEMEREGAIPELSVFVDSPMAEQATALYQRFIEDYDEKSLELLRNGITPIRTARTRFCQSREQSKALNELQGPRIIISASGMVTGGRILHHLTRWLGDERATVLFVGYQGEGTRGRIIQSGAKEIKIFGKMVPIRAQIKTISGLSAHADVGELSRWLGCCSGRPGNVIVTHGEPESAQAFAAMLQQDRGWNASVGVMGQVIEL